MRKKENKARIREVAKNIFEIRLGSWISAIKIPVNLYFFAGEDGFLWDSGYGDASASKKVYEAIEAIRKTMVERGEKCELKRLFVSHAHMDHFSGLAGLRELTGAKVVLTASQACKIKDRNAFLNLWRGNPRAVPEKLPFYYYYMNHLYSTLERLLFNLRFLRDPDEIIPESGILRAGSRIFRYFPIPGHANDHLALYDAQEGLLFTGDHVFKHATWMGPPLCSIADYEKSLEKMMALNSLKEIFTSHGPSIKNPVEQMEKTLKSSRNKRKKVLAVLEAAGDKGLPFYEILLKTWPKASVFYRLSGHGWVYLSLEELLKEGKIEVRFEKGQRIFFKRNLP